jgi:hypothetical protein
MTKKMYSIRSEAADVSAVAGDWMCDEATLVRGENAWKNAMSSFITIRLPRCSTIQLYNRYRHRFFDQVGHETTYATVGNHHFFTKTCHRQTYQNY